MSVQDVSSALQLQGVSLTYQAVAAWFNGGRGERWLPEVLHAVLNLLQTDLRTMLGEEAAVPPDVVDPIFNAVSREIAALSEQQQAALLTHLRSFRS